MVRWVGVLWILLDVMKYPVFLFEGIPYVYSIIIVYCLSKGRNLLHSLSMEGFFDEGQAGDTFLCICIWNSFQKSIKLMFLAVSSSIKIMPPNLYSRVGFLTLNILLFNLGYLLLHHLEELHESLSTITQQFWSHKF